MDDAGFFIIGLIIAGVAAALIAKDAQSRGMSGAGWGIFTFLMLIVAVPIYLIVRKPRLDQQVAASVSKIGTGGFYISRAGTQAGPYTIDQLRSMLAAGTVLHSDLCWFEGCTAWIPVSSVPGLSLPPIPPPPPPPFGQQRPGM